MGSAADQDVLAVQPGAQQAGVAEVGALVEVERATEVDREGAGGHAGGAVFERGGEVVEVAALEGAVAAAAPGVETSTSSLALPTEAMAGARK